MFGALKVYCLFVMPCVKQSSISIARQWHGYIWSMIKLRTHVWAESKIFSNAYHSLNSPYSPRQPSPSIKRQGKYVYTFQHGLGMNLSLAQGWFVDGENWSPSLCPGHHGGIPILSRGSESGHRYPFHLSFTKFRFLSLDDEVVFKRRPVHRSNGCDSDMSHMARIL